MAFFILLVSENLNLMESKDFIYKNGHFYDKITEKRVGIVDGAKICIIAPSESFTSFLPAGRYPLKILSRGDKEFEIRNQPDLAKWRKIYDKGHSLYFSITRSVGEITIVHEFKVELMEDLYLYVKKGWKQQDGKLYDCACIVRENISRSIDFFEEVNAGSLNEAYKYTFVHYFGNDGNPACNAIDRFYDSPGKEENKLRRLRDCF